jgi:hypothetical protein
MNTEIRLLVAIEVQRAQRHATHHWLLEDTSVDGGSFIDGQARPGDAKGKQFHVVPRGYRNPGSVPPDTGPKTKLDVLAIETTRLGAVCSNPFPFYKIDSLLPSVESREQVPSDS